MTVLYIPGIVKFLHSRFFLFCFFRKFKWHAPLAVIKTKQKQKTKKKKQKKTAKKDQKTIYLKVMDFK